MTSRGGERKKACQEQPSGAIQLKPKVPVGKFPKSGFEENNIGKDVLRHEKLLNQLWKWKWNFLLQHNYEDAPSLLENERLIENDQRRKKLGLVPYQVCEKDEVGVKSSVSPFPIKSSEVIGWRSKNPENSFDLFNSSKSRNSKFGKIIFSKEEYGYYRQKKLMNCVKTELKMGSLSFERGSEFRENNSFKEPLVQQSSLPSKRIKHFVNPLLC